MTKNKMDAHVEDNMIDDLLPDNLKKKKPAPAPTTTYSGYGGSDYGGGFNSGYWSGDDMFGHVPPSRSFKPTPKLNGISAYQARKASRAEGVFFDCATAIENIMHNANSSGNPDCVVLLPEEATKIVSELMREVGDCLEEAGIIWTTKGMQGVKDALLATLPLCKYGEMGASGAITKYKEVVIVDGSNPDHHRSEIAGLGEVPIVPPKKPGEKWTLSTTRQPAPNTMLDVRFVNGQYLESVDCKYEKDGVFSFASMKDGTVVESSIAFEWRVRHTLED